MRLFNLRNFKNITWKEISEGAKIKIAIFFSFLCFIIVILRVIFPKLLLDQNTIFLLVLGFLPWLTLFFKKLKLPGGFDMETEQGITNTPVAPKTGGHLPANDEQLSGPSKKMLATLWRYQTQSFKDDYTKRWTFLIYPNSPLYMDFISGLAQLLNLSLVTVQAENSQVLLTYEGINYIKQHTEIQNYSDFYVF